MCKAKDFCNMIAMAKKIADEDGKQQIVECKGIKVLINPLRSLESGGSRVCAFLPGNPNEELVQGVLEIFNRLFPVGIEVK